MCFLLTEGSSNLKKLLLVGLVACLGINAGAALAANTASANSHAYILTPLNLSPSDLDFGRIATNETNCTVTITPLIPGTHTRSTAGGNCWLDPADNGNDADWATNGEIGYSYTLELTANSDMAAFTPCGGDNSIDVDQWQADSDDIALSTFSGPAGDSGTISGFLLDGPPSPGADAFAIGATAHISLNQCPGMYTGSYTLKATYP